MFVTQTASTSFDLPRVAVYKAFAFPTKIWKALLPQTHLFVGEGVGEGGGGEVFRVEFGKSSQQFWPGLLVLAF